MTGEEEKEEEIGHVWRMNEIRNIGLLLFLLVITVPVLVQASFAADPMQDGIGLYKKGQYKLALGKFQEANKADPANEKAHYYSAFCYQGLGFLNEAKNEYRWLNDNAKDPVIKQNALAAYRKLINPTQGSTQPAATGGGGATSTNVPASSYFFTQVNDPKWNRNASEHNLNCGPACLAMVFKRYGIFPPGVSGSDPQGLIQATRVLINGSTEDCEIKGREITVAARKVGMKTKYIDTLEEIDAACAAGHLVICLGNPFQPRSYGNRIGISSFEQGHFILVTGKAGGFYVVNDPYYLQGPLNLSTGELDGFLNFYRGKHTGNCIELNP